MVHCMSKKILGKINQQVIHMMCAGAGAEAESLKETQASLTIH